MSCYTLGSFKAAVWNNSVSTHPHRKLMPVILCGCCLLVRFVTHLPTTAKTQGESHYKASGSYVWSEKNRLETKTTLFYGCRLNLPLWMKRVFCMLLALLGGKKIFRLLSKLKIDCQSKEWCGYIFECDKEP